MEKHKEGEYRYKPNEFIWFLLTKDCIFFHYKHLMCDSNDIVDKDDAFSMATQWAEQFNNALSNYAETVEHKHKISCLSCGENIYYYYVTSHLDSQHSGQSIKSANKGL